MLYRVLNFQMVLNLRNNFRIQHVFNLGHSFLWTVIYPDIVLVLLPLAFFTVKLTVYFPALLYVCAGFLAVEYVPSPKLHFHEVGDPVLLSVNCTFNGAFPEVGDAEKAATGFSERSTLYSSLLFSYCFPQHSLLLS